MHKLQDFKTILAATHLLFNFNRLALGNQSFLIRVQLLAMCRGVIVQVCLRVCEAGESDCEELMKCAPTSPAILRFVNVRERKPT